MTGREHIVHAATLARLLAEIPDGWSVQPNLVGNLSILDDTGDYAGYVDLAEETTTLFWEPRRKAEPMFTYSGGEVVWRPEFGQPSQAVYDAEVAITGADMISAEMVVFERGRVTVVANGAVTFHSVEFDYVVRVDTETERAHFEATVLPPVGSLDGRRIVVSWAYPATERTVSPAGD